MFIVYSGRIGKLTFLQYNINLSVFFKKKHHNDQTQ